MRRPQRESETESKAQNFNLTPDDLNLKKIFGKHYKQKMCCVISVIFTSRREIIELPWEETKVLLPTCWRLQKGGGKRG
jgi:hypothetical protein